MPEVALLNGKVVPMNRAAIPVDDWGVRYGWGLFETIRVHQGCPIFLERHLSRLCRAAPLLGLTADPKMDTEYWTSHITRALKRARLREAVVNCYWTHGSPASRPAQTRVIRVRPMPSYPPRPLRLWLAPWRIEPTFPGTGLKTMAYFPYIFAGVAARRAQCDEVLLLNTAGRVADGAASSIFSLRGNQLVTATLPEGALAGVTRSVLLELAGSILRPARVREARLSWKALLSSDAIILTSALRGMVPVTKIAGYWTAPKSKSSLLERLHHAYSMRVAEEVSRWHEKT